MFRDAQTFSSFSIDDIDAAQSFYADTLGLDVEKTDMGFLELKLRDGSHVNVYTKPNHQPATFTVLNFIVPDIDSAVDELVASGVTMERYENIPQIKQDARGIARDDNGPAIAWFKDPAGNVLAVLETT
jgi:catechol 2,3-dioxygenase-like lactoylglutathione lyase family enzyme